jgi:hypothetical protein
VVILVEADELERRFLADASSNKAAVSVSQAGDVARGFRPVALRFWTKSNRR